ncbi:MAG: 30S ribosomal protein S21 [Zetaproteobacteria bacterium]|nr:MAG: 30S ribosomal protein S21 [Zetaproteobacteria bacterium]
MPGVKVDPNEPFELALKRFRKQVEEAQVLKECRKREFYMKPGVRRRMKEAQARKRLMKRLRRIRQRQMRDF